MATANFFALLFMVLILAGLPMWPLHIFAAAASVWILFVIGSLLPSRAATLASENV